MKYFLQTMLAFSQIYSMHVQCSNGQISIVYWFIKDTKFSEPNLQEFVLYERFPYTQNWRKWPSSHDNIYFEAQSYNLLYRVNCEDVKHLCESPYSTI